MVGLFELPKNLPNNYMHWRDIRKRPLSPVLTQPLS
jgi:hypothetical protein